MHPVIEKLGIDPERGSAVIRFGIMGAGGIAVKFCAAAELVEDVKVVAIASKSLERAQSFARENRIKDAYGNYEEMLARSDIDIVYIATTCNFHYENCLQALSYKKAILCEKSMVMNHSQAQAVFDQAKKQGLFVMEAMWSRFIPAVQKAKEWINTGRIGKVQLANYMGGINAPKEHRIFVPELGGGALVDLSVYPIEIVTYLVPQQLRDVKAQLRYNANSVDTTNNILLQFDTCCASLQTTVYARIPSPSGFYGSKGYIRMEQTHRADVCELYDGEFCLTEHFESPIQNGFEYQIAHVRDCLTAGKIESDIMPHSATLQCLDVFEICRKMEKVKE